MIVWLGWIAASTAVGLHLDRKAEVSTEETDALLAAIEHAVEARDDLTAVLDDTLWTCEVPAACPDEVRSRTNASDVLLLRFFAGVTRIRVVASRHTTGSSEPVTAQIDVSLDRSGWPRAIDDLVQRLFPESTVTHPPPVTAQEAPPVEQPLPVLPVLSIVSGSVAGASLISGIVLGVVSRRSRTAAEDPTIDDLTYDRLADRTQILAIAANVTFAIAGAAAITGLVLYLLDL